MSIAIYIYSRLLPEKLQEKMDIAVSSSPNAYEENFLLTPAKPVKPRQLQGIDEFDFPASSFVIVEINKRDSSPEAKGQAILHLVSGIDLNDVLLLTNNEELYEPVTASRS